MTIIIISTNDRRKVWNNGTFQCNKKYDQIQKRIKEERRISQGKRKALPWKDGRKDNILQGLASIFYLGYYWRWYSMHRRSGRKEIVVIRRFYLLGRGLLYERSKPRRYWADAKKQLKFYYDIYCNCPKTLDNNQIIWYNVNK